MHEGAFPAVRRRKRSWPDIVIAGLALGAVVLLLVPLPTWLLDVLLAGNLAMSLVLLLVALQVDSPLRVAAFPTWVVLSTLIRLALNVSSTRLILLQADAGQVIRAYGELVAGANAIVGGVLFALLTIVQFVVIARGAERVAEVGARFVLDGLPGKQMAIDGELRAKTIDARQAEARRLRLIQESQFFGSMDGAMKFVKGDVIASLLIIAVNLLGGFGIGVGQKRLDAVTALGSYGLLTIGDGLAAQIPALLVATAAGVLVTRVAGETKAGIGPELASQLLRHPKALSWVSLACLVVALVPKMPGPPFVAVALVCALGSILAKRTWAIQDSSRASWGLTVSSDLARWLPRPMALQRPQLVRVAHGIAEGALARLGLPSFLVERAPRLALDGHLPPRTVELWVRGAGVQRATVPDADDAAQQVIDELTPALRRHASALVGVDEIDRWLADVATHSPAMVREAIPAKVPLSTLTEAVRCLIREQVPLTQFEAVLEAIAHPQFSLTATGDHGSVAAVARQASRQALSQQLLKAHGTKLRCVRFDALIEDTLLESLHRVGKGTTLALAPAAVRDIIDAFRRALADLPPGPLILLAPATLRGPLRELVEADFPDIPVISPDELLPSLEIQLAAMVRLTRERPRAAPAQAVEPA